jgi:hypothetical protein
VDHPSDPFDRFLGEAGAGGEPLVLATALTGPGAGRRLLVWSAGHTFGDLGWPRLNQRVALYAEQLLERGGREASEKRFEVPGGPPVTVRLELPSGTAP